jgi:hypothetical protein
VVIKTDRSDKPENKKFFLKISDHQQSWGYEDGPWKGPGPPLLGVADFVLDPAPCADKILQVISKLWLPISNSC